MPGVVSNSVPTPACVAGNGGVRSQGAKSKVSLNHPDKPGEGKAGRMNASEPSMRRHHHSRSSSEMMGAIARDDELSSTSRPISGMPRVRVDYSRIWDTTDMAHRRHPPQPHLTPAERDNPVEVW